MNERKSLESQPLSEWVNNNIYFFIAVSIFNHKLEILGQIIVRRLKSTHIY